MLIVIDVENFEIKVVIEMCIFVVCCVEMLGELMCYCYGIVVVGIYGKIMIISFVMCMLVEENLDLIYVIGGLLNCIGVNVVLGVSCFIVVEVDELDVLFLYL